MWFAMVLVCGLEMPLNPSVVDGCAYAMTRTPQTEETVCILETLPDLVATAPLPMGAFIADAQCIHLKSGEPT